MKRKKHIDNFLKKYNKNEQMFEPFFNIYNDILNTKNNSWEIYEKHLPYIDLMLYMLLMTNSDNTNKEVYIKESNNLISSMIIDYHFNEYDLNVFIDIKQLLEFNKMIKNLSDEDVKLYNKILNIYELSYEEKMQLHEYLKSINMIEKFYDHIRNSKNISYNLFKEKSLNTNSLFNKEKSKELDIDVYELKGEEFTALIKAGVSYSSKIDKPSGCFSMIGDNCLGTYGTPDDRITIVYGDFDPNYIIHMFTEDSYSAPVTDDTTEVTNRVNLIMTPEEFQKNTCTYNEVVINYGKNLGNDIVIPKSKFILCYDEIKEIHKKAALDFKLPILVIHTKYYDKTKNKTEIEQRSYYVDALNVEKIRTQR